MNNKLLPMLAIMLSLFIANVAWAHSSMTMTPKDGETLTQAPKFIQIEFGKMVRVLKLNIVDSIGNEVSFITEDAKKFTTLYRANLEELEKGEYFITWRAIGKDGHPMKNKFSFNIK